MRPRFSTLQVTSCKYYKRSRNICGGRTTQLLRSKRRCNVAILETCSPADFERSNVMRRRPKNEKIDIKQPDRVWIWSDSVLQGGSLWWSWCKHPDPTWTYRHASTCRIVHAVSPSGSWFTSDNLFWNFTPTISLSVRSLVALTRLKGHHQFATKTTQVYRQSTSQTGMKLVENLPQVCIRFAFSLPTRIGTLFSIYLLPVWRLFHASDDSNRQPFFSDFASGFLSVFRLFAPSFHASPPPVLNRFPAVFPPVFRQFASSLYPLPRQFFF